MNVPRIRNAAVLVGVAGLAASGLGWSFDPGQFFRSYLVSYMLWFGIALGSVSLLMIFHMTGGNWGILTRHLFESSSRTIPLMLLLLAPVMIGIPHLYVWSHPDVVAANQALRHKASYLNTGAFLLRAAFYFAVWVGLMLLLNRRGTPAGTRLRTVSGPGLVIHAFVVSFAIIDWIMSLQAEWFSTIFPAIFLIGQLLSALALGILGVLWLGDENDAVSVVAPGRMLDLGNLMLAFVMLWAYTSFSQFLIIWSGNLPDENPWYIRRLQGGWEWIALMLLLFHFAVPFLLLLSRWVKRRPKLLSAIAGSMIVMRFLDLYWNIQPSHWSSFHVHWLDAATLVGIGGIWVGAFLWHLKRGLWPEHAALRSSVG